MNVISKIIKNKYLLNEERKINQNTQICRNLYDIPALVTAVELAYLS